MADAAVAAVAVAATSAAAVDAELSNCCQEPPHTREDILRNAEVPDGDHEGWGYLH